MIISHSNRFIFIKTEKTAGSSLEIALAEFCSGTDVLTPLFPEEEFFKSQNNWCLAQNHKIPFSDYSIRDWAKALYKQSRLGFETHSSATEVRLRLGEPCWNDYFKFAVERNPWDKMISYYHWLGGEEKWGSIKQFMLDGIGGRIKAFDLYSQWGVPIVDRVIRFENLSADLQSIGQTIGLPSELKMPSYRAKSSSRSDKRPYQAVLSAEEAEIIAKVFAREIAFCGYEFES